MTSKEMVKFPGFGSLLARSWRLFTENFVCFFVFGVVFGLIFLAIDNLFVYFDKVNEVSSDVFITVSSIFVGIVFEFAAIEMIRRLIKKEAVSVAILLDASRDQFRDLLVTSLCALKELLWPILILIAGWALSIWRGPELYDLSMLFFVVGFIYLLAKSIGLMFVYQAFVLDGKKGPQAIKRSKKIVSSGWFRILLYLIGASLLVYLCLLPFYILLFLLNIQVIADLSILLEMVVGGFAASFAVFFYYDLAKQIKH